MNLIDLHQNEKEVSTSKLNETVIDAVISIRIKKDGILAKHITKTPAILICISGETIYETEKGQKEVLKNGDMVKIEANVLHWLNAVQESSLILLK